VVKLGVVLLLSCAAHAATLRVLTYNLHHCQGMDGKVDVERIAAVIRSVKPDIVALQEVDRNVSRSGRTDQAAELGRLTGMEAIFGRAIDLDTGQYGNAVLTRLPVRASATYPLPGAEPRVLLEVEFEGFRFFSTHLDVGRDEGRRLESVAEINRRAKGPSILAGDLNAALGSGPLQALAAEWKLAGEGQSLPTFPSRSPTRQIDFILFRPAAGWRVVEVRVIEEPVASDHAPLFAVLERE
jgi:endonuclease/exonuclease/phosphatase family metal-dependent hydrolase